MEREVEGGGRSLRGFQSFQVKVGCELGRTAYLCPAAIANRPQSPYRLLYNLVILKPGISGQGIFVPIQEILDRIA